VIDIKKLSINNHDKQHFFALSTGIGLGKFKTFSYKKPQKKQINTLENKNYCKFIFEKIIISNYFIWILDICFAVILAYLSIKCKSVILSLADMSKHFSFRIVFNLFFRSWYSRLPIGDMFAVLVIYHFVFYGLKIRSFGYLLLLSFRRCLVQS